jgi:hypothetical protein
MAEVWTDPAAMTDSQIEAELGEVALKLAEARASDSRVVNSKPDNGGYGPSRRSGSGGAMDHAKGKRNSPQRTEFRHARKPNDSLLNGS